MSAMNGDEPLVSAPNKWADQIYGSDLSPLGNVGVPIHGSPANTSFLTDYVSNLNHFRTGNFIMRPTANVPSRLNAIMLPPPDWHDPITNGVDASART